MHAHFEIIYSPKYLIIHKKILKNCIYDKYAEYIIHLVALLLSA